MLQISLAENSSRSVTLCSYYTTVLDFPTFFLVDFFSQTGKYDLSKNHP